MGKHGESKKGRLYLLIIPLLLCGACILFWPSFSDWMARRDHQAVLESYRAAVEGIPADVAQQALAGARDYNANLHGGGTLTDPFGSGQFTDAEYETLLSFDGVMARLRIPEISVDLPVYHGTTEPVLQKGVGHLFGSSLPVGGAGTHAVLTAHSALPNAVLFTDLEKLQTGHRFYIDVLNDTLVYEVDKITVIEPNETGELQIIEGQEYVTLVTCTPYGVNSHRLLVRGSRVDMSAESARQEIEEQIVMPELSLIFVAAIAAAVLLVILIIVIIYKVKRKKVRR